MEEKIVYCENCIAHKNCSVEDSFATVGVEKGFCAAGREYKKFRREENLEVKE